MKATGFPRPLALLLCLFAVAAPLFGARAQDPQSATFQLTVIVSDVGADAAQGELERRVAEAWAARQRGRGGIFGRPVIIDVRSDGGSVEGALRHAESAIDLDAHAIVCCSTPAASLRVAEVAERAGVPLLAPTNIPDGSFNGWAHALASDDVIDLQATVRDIYQRGGRDLALMTLEGTFGDAVRSSLDALLAAPGLGVVADVRYPPDAPVLTPEALRTAVALPDAIIVWGLRNDTQLAIDGLRDRGWTGAVYLRPAVVAATVGGTTLPVRGDVRLMVSPASAPGAIRENQPVALWAREARALGGGVLESRPLRADGARMHDALSLLALAFEQVSTYGIDIGDVASVRSALRDALVGLPPIDLAAGRYDLSMDESTAARAEGLVAVRLVEGRPVPLE